MSGEVQSVEIELNLGDLYQNISAGGSEDQDWERTVFFSSPSWGKVPKEYYSKTFRNSITPKDDLMFQKA